MQSKSFTVTLSVVAGLYIFLVSCVMLKSRRNDRLIAVEGALLIISALLLSPVSSQSHFVGLLLPYALLTAALIKDASRRVFYSAMVLLSFVLLTATSNDLVGRSLTDGDGTACRYTASWCWSLLLRCWSGRFQAPAVARAKPVPTLSPRGNR